MEVVPAAGKLFSVWLLAAVPPESTEFESDCFIFCPVAVSVLNLRHIWVVVNLGFQAVQTILPTVKLESVQLDIFKSPPTFHLRYLEYIQDTSLYLLFWPLHPHLINKYILKFELKHFQILIFSGLVSHVALSLPVAVVSAPKLQFPAPWPPGTLPLTVLCGRCLFYLFFYLFFFFIFLKKK